MAAGFKSLNAVVHAITAEEGGDSEIEARLTARGATELGFKIHSDPEHKLLLRNPDGAVSDVYLVEKMKCSSMDRSLPPPSS